MNDFNAKKISGTGWSGLVIQLKDSDDFDLLKLVESMPEKYPFFLESSSRGNDQNRNSIVFYKPNIVLKKEKNQSMNLLKEFDTLWQKNKINQNETVFDNRKIPFCGGWFVYLGYELANEIEEKIDIPNSPYLLPDAFIARVHSSIIFDHISKRIIITSDRTNELNDIDDMLSDLNNLKPESSEEKANGYIKIHSKGSSDEHQNQVRTCIDYIYQGEIFQANLSRLWRFKIQDNLSDVNIYKQLREKNPSPFAGIVRFNDSTIISSSPERLISISGKHLQTRPIAGTRPRGRSALLDIELTKELINSDKEKAEHLMLVDLERNDISKVCEAGSVRVDEMMTIETYAHVHHIVSNISGIKKNNISPGDAIRSVFPGGTITGCPKFRCMEILGELEKQGRGPYTGSFGYVTHNGDMDLNILIRTILKENNDLFFRAGGGIVADSIPQNETLETEAKANGMLRAVGSFKNE
ncbi:MAG: chorismate-binding protein [Alphaproteobacteria bacterium]